MIMMSLYVFFRNFNVQVQVLSPRIVYAEAKIESAAIGATDAVMHSSAELR